MSTTLQQLLDPMFRAAGIHPKPGVGASADMYTEAIGMVNRMLASYNLDGHRIYTTDIKDFALVSGQKIYTIGPGGDFNTARPIYIKEANIMFPTSPVVRRRLYIMDDDEWSSISVQDIPGAPSLVLYYDGGFDANGRGNIYLWYQDPSDYRLELYTWLALKSDFTAISDAVVLPPGYEELIVQNGAVRLAALWPHEANLSQLTVELADKALINVITSNANCPKQENEAGFSADKVVGGYRGWLSGDIQ